MFVHVISKDGQPLMPTSRFGKVRRLLKNKKAKVVRRCPFTIKLLYEPESLVVQEVVLEQDTGSKHVGTACIANNKVLYQSQVQLRTNIKSKMDSRRQSRRFRRDRKTRYRKPRFLNRANSTKRIGCRQVLGIKYKHILMKLNFARKFCQFQRLCLR